MDRLALESVHTHTHSHARKDAWIRPHDVSPVSGGHRRTTGSREAHSRRTGKASPGMRPVLSFRPRFLAEGLAAPEALVRLLLQSGKRDRNASECRAVLGKGYIGRILASSEGAAAHHSAMNSKTCSGNRSTQNLLGSLKTTNVGHSSSIGVTTFLFPFSPDCPKEGSAGLLWPNHLLDWTWEVFFPSWELMKRKYRFETNSLGPLAYMLQTVHCLKGIPGNESPEQRLTNFEGKFKTFELDCDFKNFHIVQYFFLGRMFFKKSKLLLKMRHYLVTDHRL